MMGQIAIRRPPGYLQGPSDRPVEDEFKRGLDTRLLIGRQSDIGSQHQLAAGLPRSGRGLAQQLVGGMETGESRLSQVLEKRAAA